MTSRTKSLETAVHAITVQYVLQTPFSLPRCFIEGLRNVCLNLFLGTMYSYKTNENWGIIISVSAQHTIAHATRVFYDYLHGIFPMKASSPDVAARVAS